MPNAPAPLYLDEDVSVVVAAILEARGFVAVTARDTGRLGRVDFERLHRKCLETGRPHAGIIIARRRTPAELAARVGRLISRLTADEMKNQVFYV